MYLDDILVFSPDVPQHLKDLRAVFERLRKEKFFAKRQKYKFGKSSVKYLGHIVEAGHIRADPDKVEAIRTWPAPTNVKEL